MPPHARPPCPRRGAARRASLETSAVIATPSVERQRRLLRAAQVGDDDARALGGEPVGDRAADALRRAGDDGDLAVERAHQRTGEKDVGTRMRFCCVWISGWIFARNAFHASSAWSFARRSSRSAKLS